MGGIEHRVERARGLSLFHFDVQYWVFDVGSSMFDVQGSPDLPAADWTQRRRGSRPAACGDLLLWVYAFDVNPRGLTRMALT